MNRYAALVLVVFLGACSREPSGTGPAPALILTSTARADDWPQWRGPDRSGVSKEKGLLKAWPKDGPKLLWTYDKADLGFSAPAVVGDTLYILGTRGDKDEVVIALDVNKGTELWTTTLGPIFTFEGNVWGDGPRSTPTIDGDYLYALGAQGELVCLDRTAKGKELWRVNMLKDLKGEVMPRSDYNWGYSESPLVDGNLLLCTPGAEQGTVAALDKKTGKVMWRSIELKNKAPYSSIMAANIQGVRQYIQTSYDTEGGHISGIAAENGKLLWSQPMFKKDSYGICPTPIVRDNLVYATAGYGGGSHLYEISKALKAKDRYAKAEQKNVNNTHGGVVLIGDHIFGHTGDNKRSKWVCQNFMTGELAWEIENGDSLPGISGSIMSAEGLLYLCSDQGVVALVEANPKEWKEISRFTLPAKNKFQDRPRQRSAGVWAHPVIANGRLYLRDQELVFCYDIRK